MIFEAKHQGKWVAIKDEEPIAHAKRLDLLIKMFQKRSDFKEIAFALVPKGLVG